MFLSDFLGPVEQGGYQGLFHGPDLHYIKTDTLIHHNINYDEYGFLKYIGNVLLLVRIMFRGSKNIRCPRQRGWYR